MADSTTVKHDKKALRGEIKNTLSSLNSDFITQQSQIATDRLLSLPEYVKSKSLSIYLSMPTGELQTTQLLSSALEAGKSVYVPYLHKLASPDPVTGKKRVMEMLKLRSVEEFEGLERDSWGIPSLSTEGLGERPNAIGGKGPDREGSADGGEREGLDMVVVPAMAFDESMRRLGHGAGFYDGWIKRYRESQGKKPMLVGLCLAEQLLPTDRTIPTDAWDWKMDVIVTGEGRLLTPQDS
ncbi:hypothetical protein MBLNU230_g5609t1 [Neophaeotheca triangularis]